MLAWTLPTTAAVLAAGAWPTWRLAGRAGLAGQALAAGIVVAAFLVVAGVKTRLSLKPATMMWVTMASNLVRMVIVLGATVIGQWVLHLPVKVVLIWLVIAYASMLTGEALWLVRTSAAWRAAEAAGCPSGGD